MVIFHSYFRIYQNCFLTLYYINTFFRIFLYLQQSKLREVVGTQGHILGALEAPWVTKGGAKKKRKEREKRGKERKKKKGEEKHIER